MTGEFKIRVRYEETDRMGVVYYGNYFTWFEVGRAELMRSLGVTYREMEEMGILLPVTDADCHYKNPAVYDELLTIKTSVSRLTGVRIVFAYSIFNEAGKLIVEGSTSHAFVNAEGRPVNVTKKEPDLWNLINKAAI